MYPASRAQKRTWFLSRLQRNSSAFTVVRAYWVHGELDPQRLERCLAELARRHHILRSRFQLAEDRLVQVVLPDVRLEVRVVEVATGGGIDPAASALERASRSAGQPIDVDQTPLCRCEVYRLDAAHHLLTLVIHGLLADEASIDLLVREIAALYDASKASTAGTPPAPVFQFGKFARWQEEALRQGSLKEDLARWIRLFPPPVPTVELTLDHPRPAMQSFAGRRQVCSLPVDLAREITDLCDAMGTEPSAGLLAAFQILLHRYTAQEEILVGVEVDGRQEAQTRELVGPLGNTLPLKAVFTGESTFRQLLRETARMLEEAQVRPGVPFEALIEALEPDRDLGVPPLCPVRFAFERPPAAAPGLGGATLVPVNLGLRMVPCDLKLNTCLSGAALLLGLDYNPELFDRSTIDRMLAQFEVLLRGILETPDSRIHELPLLTELERHQLLVEWNDTTRDYPRDKCLHHLFEDSARRIPEAVAVEADGRRLTYGELNALADRLADRLRVVGVGPDTIVPLCLERSLDMVIGILGILKAGGAYLPMDPTYPRERLGLMLDECHARMIVTQPRLGELMVGRNATAIYVEPARSPKDPPAPTAAGAVVSPGNLAYVMYTSGSTGRPKGVLVTHRNVVHSTCARWLEYEGQVTAFLMPYSHAFDSSVAGIFWTLSQGGRLVLPSVGQEKDPAGLARIIAEAGVTHLDCLPSLYGLLLESGRSGDLRSLKVVIVGGEACPAGLPAEHHRRLPGTRLYNEYGPTECTVWATVHCLAEPTGGASVPIGRPIPNMQAYVLDAHRQSVPPGVPGELYLGGDGVALGYLNEPELTAASFVPNPFDPGRSPRLYRTGDRVRFLRGGILEYLGRTDRQVKVRGYRIETGEIEAALAAHPAVIESVVIAREDTPGVKRLVAYLRSRGTVSAKELAVFLKARLPGHMVPAAFAFLGSFPRTPNGKVDLRALPAPPPVRPDGDTAFSQPTNTVQAQLVALWEQMLGVHPIGIRCSFFELGGDSLLAARLYLEIERQFGITLPLAMFFQAPTIERLAEVLGRETAQQTWSSLVPIQPQGSRPPLFLVAGSGGNVVGYEPLARHLGPDQPVYGLQSWGLSGRHPPHTQIEEMAAHYIREMRALQPQGPYSLAGLSFGGMVAFEMAQQLHKQGQPVGFVALFDTDYLGPLDQLNAWQALVRRFHLTRHRLGDHARQIRDLRRAEVGAFVRGKAEILRTRFKNRISENAFRLHEIGKVSLANHLQNVRAANHLALRRYRPKVYPGRLTLFRAGLPSEDSAAWHPWAAWRILAAGGLTIQYVPGDHVTILHEPYVGVLAEKLTACIVKSAPRP